MSSEENDFDYEIDDINDIGIGSTVDEEPPDNIDESQDKLEFNEQEENSNVKDDTENLENGLENDEEAANATFRSLGNPDYQQGFPSPDIPSPVPDRYVEATVTDIKYSSKGEESSEGKESSEGEESSENTKSSSSENSNTPDLPSESVRGNKRKGEIIKNYILEHPNAGTKEIADATGATRQTVSKYMKEIKSDTKEPDNLGKEENQDIRAAKKEPVLPKITIAKEKANTEQTAFKDESSPTASPAASYNLAPNIKTENTKKTENNVWKAAIVIMAAVIILVFIVFINNQKKVENKGSKTTGALENFIGEISEEEITTEMATIAATEEIVTETIHVASEVTVSEITEAETQESPSEQASELESIEIENTESSNSSRFANLDELSYYINSQLSSVIANEKMLLNQYKNGEITKDEYKESIQKYIDDVNYYNHLLVANKSLYEDEGKSGDYDTLSENINNVIIYGDELLYE